MAWDGHRDLYLSMHLLNGVEEWQRWAHPSIFQQFLGGTNERGLRTTLMFPGLG